MQKMIFFNWVQKWINRVGILFILFIFLFFKRFLDTVDLQ